MILGILQTGHVPDEVKTRHGDYTALYGAMFPGRGYTLKTFSVVDGAFPDGPGDADAWLVTGSRHGAYEDHDWIPPLEDLIRAIHAGGRPLVGICFGHQIVAQALGGRVEKFSGGWSTGRTLYDFEGVPLALNAWHQDQVIRPPEGAETIASGRRCAHAALRIGPHTLTVQAHPEFDARAIRGLIEHRSGSVPAERLAQAEAGLALPVDNARIAQIGRAHV